MFRKTGYTEISGGQKQTSARSPQSTSPGKDESVIAKALRFFTHAKEESTSVESSTTAPRSYGSFDH